MDEKGVKPQSSMYFYSPSSFAQKALYYLIYGGEFWTTKDYFIERDNWNSYLILYVEEGSLQVEYQGAVYVAEQGSVVLLNCYQPHKYFSEKAAHFKWFHFAGNASHIYFKRIYEKHGCLFKEVQHSPLHQLIQNVLDLSSAEQMDEELVSVKISQIMYELNHQTEVRVEAKDTRVIEEAVRYMNSHYPVNLTLNDLASHVNLSPYHFSRAFKKSTGESPIHYLIQLRLNKAKSLLHTTRFTISEISYKCGFNSESHFITTFKKKNHLTPNQFRGVKF